MCSSTKPIHVQYVSASAGKEYHNCKCGQATFGIVSWTVKHRIRIPVCIVEQHFRGLQLLQSLEPLQEQQIIQYHGAVLQSWVWKW